ncbi:MAG: GWxTD domain-containing protein [Bryobacteraceae bacterium]
MMLLETFIHSALASALGWTVLHSLWQGAIVSSLLGIFLLAVRSPRARYAAACLAMLAILAGFAITLIYLMPAGGGALWTPHPVDRSLGSPTLGPAIPDAWDRGLTTVVPWLAPFWILGVFLFYARHVLGLISISRLRNRGVCAPPAQWQRQITRIAERLQLSRPILLLESCFAETPMVIGHLRPLILMPIGVLSGMPKEQVEAILLHELAHIRRYDYLVNSVQRLVDGFLFYHPAAWWLTRLIRTERENCCDDVAVSISGRVREYAVALASLEQARWSGREPAVAVRGGNLVKRIQRLLYPQGPSSAWTPIFAALILVVTAAFSLGAWQPGKYGSPATNSQPEGVKNAVYSKWLNEEVVYIISPQEREAFEGLTTNDERNKFIEQFWLRRDPTPGTPENEFKTEHYRRIAFANSHFASDRPGWQTDRGRIYILNGPPDEIDSHPRGDATIAFPYDWWLYHGNDNRGSSQAYTFVDRDHNRDYRLEN